MAGKPGRGGPTPKRTEARHGHRTAAEKVEVTQGMAGIVPIWPDAPAEWHSTAKAMYEGLKDSGQARYYEQSDVAMALYCCELMSDTLTGWTDSDGVDRRKINGQLVTAVMAGLQSLLATEDARRRAKLELTRVAQVDTDEEKADATVTDLMSRLGGANG